MTRPEVFGRFADEYERHRPDYPAAMWSVLLADASIRRVLDLGCGTGRAGRELCRRGYEVIGLDPERGMLAEARRAAGHELLPLRLVAARAERLAFAARSFDLVTAAQAFHWFDTETALAEVHRILRPAGYLAMWWNDRRTDVPYMMEYEALLERFNPSYRRGYRQDDWLQRIGDSNRFAEIRRDDFQHARSSGVEDFVGLASTSSYIRNVLTAERLQEFQQEVRRLLYRHFGERSFEVAYQTRLFRARAAPAGLGFRTRKRS